MAYRIQFTRNAENALAKLDRRLLIRVKAKIFELADNPRPTGSARLAGHRHYSRIRIGDYRVIYRVDDQSNLVEISRIAHRRELYRDL